MPPAELDSYLRLLASMLKLRERECEAIRAEIAAHMAERLRDLEAGGWRRDDAIEAIIEEFGDADRLASQFSQVRSIRRQKKVQRTASAMVGVAACLVAATFVWSAFTTPYDRGSTAGITSALQGSGNAVEGEAIEPIDPPAVAVVSFDYVGRTPQAWTVPAGVTAIDVDVRGAGGGSPNGLGGRVRGRLAVTPGETLYIVVGGRGTQHAGSIGGRGGYNGGGDGGNGAGGNAGGQGGGGASDVRQGSTALDARVIVAGGGGGAGCGGCSQGGSGGGHGRLAGEDYGPVAGGSGGTLTAGGPGGLRPVAGESGGFGEGGDGATGAFYGGGGGGGGYYGGGGGATDIGGGGAAAGGGGSSLVPPGGLTVAGFQNGDGQVVLSYAPVLDGDHRYRLHQEASRHRSMGDKAEHTVGTPQDSYFVASGVHEDLIR